jgi:hypothetical protein
MAVSRRDVLRAAPFALAGALAAPFAAAAGPRASGPVPLIHTTDLYHPPQDPDDHVDLATLYALDALDVRAVVLDASRRFLRPAPEGFDIARDPGFVPVVQLGALLGRSVPVGAGPTAPLQSPEDDAAGAPPAEQQGVRLLLDALRASPAPAVVTVTGSARPLAVAFNREPALVRDKTRAVLLNAGFTGGTRREWNVDLDVHAYVRLWRSGLPIHWFPPATERGAFQADHEHGTFWRTTHAALFRDLVAPLRAWFAYALSGSARGDIIGALDESAGGAVWESLQGGTRNLWATASLVMAAGRALVRTADGWRFVPTAEAAAADAWPWTLDPIRASCADDGTVTWERVPDGPHRLFRRTRGEGFGVAMAEATHALLRDLSESTTPQP